MKGNIFIKRPVMAISISVLILVIGLISLFTLPVEQYPDIAPPTVYVSANYTGADAEAVLNSVIMPLEESINGVENMMYISSTATNAGSATIQVYFKQGTDPDMAAVNVQNRVSKAQGLLPAEVTKIGVTTQKRQTSFLQIGALVSTDGRYDQTFLANYLDINVIPQIKRIEGVGDVMELGDTYSMRIWLKPERMAQYGLVPSDVTAVLGEQNIEAPTGSLGENSKNVFQFTMKYRGRLKSVEEFQNTVVRSQSDGSVLRLKDVADVELGTLTYSFRSEMDSKPAVLFMMFQTAGSNATAVNKQITAQIDEMRKSLPEGTEFVTMMSSNDFLFASIHNVVETLVIAIILVILVVYFFLQDFKSTLIPSISIIVSLVGTFACLVAAGFSLNILPCHEGCDGRCDDGHHLLYLRVHGGIYPRDVYGRYFGRVLYAVRCHDGNGGGHLHDFGIDALSRLVCHHDASVGRYEECEEHQRTGACGIQCLVQRRAGQI